MGFLLWGQTSWNEPGQGVSVFEPPTLSQPVVASRIWAGLTQHLILSTNNSVDTVVLPLLTNRKASSLSALRKPKKPHPLLGSLAAALSSGLAECAEHHHFSKLPPKPFSSHMKFWQLHRQTAMLWNCPGTGNQVGGSSLVVVCPQSRPNKGADPSIWNTKNQKALCSLMCESGRGLDRKSCFQHQQTQDTPSRISHFAPTSLYHIHTSKGRG